MEGDSGESGMTSLGGGCLILEESGLVRHIVLLQNLPPVPLKLLYPLLLLLRCLHVPVLQQPDTKRGKRAGEKRHTKIALAAPHGHLICPPAMTASLPLGSITSSDNFHLRPHLYQHLLRRQHAETRHCMYKSACNYWRHKSLHS